MLTPVSGTTCCTRIWVCVCMYIYTSDVCLVVQTPKQREMLSIKCFVWHFRSSMQGWVGGSPYALVIRKFMRGSAVSKGKVAFQNPICLGFRSSSIWTCHCPSLCGFLGGLSFAAVAFVAWVLIQWFMPRLPVDLDRFSERCHSSGAFVCGMWIRFEISILVASYLDTFFQLHVCSFLAWSFR